MAQPHRFPAVARLQIEYDGLANQPARSLSVDERRGLEYFLADTVRQSSSSERINRWVGFVHELDLFVEHHGRMPVPASRSPRPQDREQILIDRLSYQRRPAVRATHCSYQIRRLEGVPGFRWSPQHDRWMDRFLAHQAFWEENHRAPERRSPVRDEAALGRWAAEQRALYRATRLRPDRFNILRRAHYRVV